MKAKTVAIVLAGAFLLGHITKVLIRRRKRKRLRKGSDFMNGNELRLLGKAVTVYTPRNGKSYTSEEIGDFLKRFQLHEMLRIIGQVSHQLFFMKTEPEARIEGVPFSDSVLAYLAMRAIESSNDYRALTMTIPDLAKAGDMYWGLADPIQVDQEVDSCLVRFGSNQFDYQRRLDNLLPRSLAIYKHLWDTVPNTVEVKSVIEKISGVTFEEIFLFTYAFTGQSTKSGGYFRLYTNVDSTEPTVIGFFRKERQQLFVDWLSCDYKKFRFEAKQEFSKIPSVFYEKQRFNPLLKFPIIKPERNPLPGASQVYIDPIPRLLHERVTRGLYFELSDQFMGQGNRNPFRQSFGFVFQEYVGELLRDALGRSNVLEERKYRVGKQEKLTPDWLIIDGDHCFLVEVKQSGLYLNAKMWGDIETVKGDLSKSIGAGVQQLWKFEQEARSDRYPELHFLSNVKEFSRIIVSYDHLYFSNSILRDRVRERFVDDSINIPADYHWHVISIDELEFVLGMHGSNFLKLLRTKQTHLTDDRLDFGDYLGKYYADRNATNPYLDRIRKEFFENFAI
jgi:hypothetical protein